ncbi:threonylcarbamoyl-AMP synthase [Roseibium denhamense]|uniref:L-threonylcarbamoyladenylate synthase n=1 Tax=Roseibium denhamense TaxID=76305 RepID=A0ABY1P8P7_9HYPH|nr:L-threonylcarbamoyladenylate synthase [Roseibium denhamense]MTI07183.1 threonylcarbamoyl-AMP synthase [Roseibium denhamense]SMP26725.1 translation factor SUA5 [Roseibium denhamense]
MTTNDLFLSNPDVQNVAHCLKDGGVVLIPTDTVLGLAAHPAHPDAVARVFALKERPVEKKLPIMVSSVEALEAIGALVTDKALALINSPFCPGPISIVLGLDPSRTPDWLSGREEMAFRMPNDPFLLKVLDAAGPLFVTSANRSGMGTLPNVRAAVDQLAGQPDLAVEGEDCGAVPSTIVNCRLSPPVIERLGAVSEAQLAEYL